MRRRGETGEGDRCEGFGRVTRADRGGDTGEYSRILFRCGGDKDRRETERGGGDGESRVIATERLFREERGGDEGGERREERGGDGVRRRS